VQHSAALPFIIKRSDDVIGSMSITMTRETVHGLLRLDGERLVIQWRLERSTEHMGSEIRTDREVDPVREEVVPLSGLAGAAVPHGWLGRVSPPRIVLTATDLRAFEGIAGSAGLRLAHPAQLVLRVRWRDRLAAREFAADLELALAERAIRAAEDGPRIGPGNG
jgi:hypothetical protein